MAGLAAPAAGGQRKREDQAGGELDADGQHREATADPLPGGEDRVDAADHRQQHEQVVVPAADSIDHEERVEAHQRGRLDRVGATPTGALPHDRHQRQGGYGGDRLVREHAGRDRQRRQQVAEDGEHRAVGTRDVGPLGPDVREHRVRVDRVRPVGVGVGVVDRAHSRVGLIAEDVGGGQRRRQQHHRIQGRDRHQDHPRRQLPGQPDDHGVGQEHHDQRRDRASDVEVEAGGAEGAGQRGLDRTDRLGQERLGVRRGHRDQAAARQQAADGGQPQPALAARDSDLRRGGRRGGRCTPGSRGACGRPAARCGSAALRGDASSGSATSSSAAGRS